jgi:ferritin-like metal-binding protein YciE
MNETTSTPDSSLRYDSSDAGDNTQRDERHTIRTYLSDMLALERHIALPLQRQLQIDDVAKYGQAATIISSIKTVSDAHISLLQDHLNKAGGDAASSLKTAFASVLGAGAAALDSARRTKISKGLRDDQVALALATISYTMLHTTALGLGDAATAELAQKHLEDYTPLVVQITKAMPAVVLQELADDGENVQITAAEIAEQNATQAWR